MTKRKAEYDLDRDQISKEDFEYTKTQKEKLEQNVGKICTPEEIAQRRILKIKSSGKPETELNQPKFTLSRPLNIETKQSEPKEISFAPSVSNNPPSFLFKRQIETDLKEEINEKKDENPLERIIQTGENKEVPKFSLFTSNQSVKPPSQEGSSPFSFIRTVMSNSEAVGGFFPKPTETAQLFSKLAEENLPKKQEENQTKIAGGTSLDLGQQPASLFSTKPTESEKMIKPTEGFFAKQPEGTLFSKTQGGLFSQPADGGIFGKPQDGELFGKPAEGLFSKSLAQSSFANLGSGSLFGNLVGGLFSNAGGGQRIKGENEDDQDNDGEENDEPNEPNSPEIEKDKSSGNYQYEELFMKIILKSIHKFKVNEKDVMEGGYLSLEKKKDNEKTIMIVYRNQAKLVLYQGLVLKSVSLVGVLNKRADSMTLTCYNERKGEEESKGKMEKDFLKIMFGNQSDCEEFKKKLEEHV